MTILDKMLENCEKAGYAERSRAKYRAIAYTLLNRKEISEAIKLYIDHVIEPYKARLEFEILDIYYRRATYLVTEFYDDFGNPKPLKDIAKEWLCCIDQIDVKVSANGNLIPILWYTRINQQAVKLKSKLHYKKSLIFGLTMVLQLTNQKLLVG